MCDACKSGTHSAYIGHTVQASDAEEECQDISEEEALAWLQQHEEDPQLHCARIFRHGVDLELLGAPQWVTQERADALRLCGFVVVDGFLSVDVAAAVRALGERYVAAGDCLRPAALTSSGDVRRAGTARGDFHAFLHPDTPPCQEFPLSEVMAAFHRLQHELARVVQLRAASQQDNEFQLALYPGQGSGYERHRDAMPDDGQSMLDDGTPVLQRRVTAIIYTSVGWEESDGGQLKLWLTPAQSAGCRAANPQPSTLTGTGQEQEVVIAPLPGRLLLFLSGAIDHSVLPCRSMRTAVTAWFH